MRISFDLDDTLICRQASAKYEQNRIPCFLKFLLNEPLRFGARFLMRELQKCDHEILIYITSYRRPVLIKLWLRCYGIKVSDVINQTIHDRYTSSKSRIDRPSKNPKLFGISLHIDDSIGVGMEGDRYGFRVLVVDPSDEEWVDKVIQTVKSINQEL